MQTVMSRSVVGSVARKRYKRPLSGRHGARGALGFIVGLRRTVEVLKRAADGSERRLAILQDGDVFGEIALLEDVPRIASIVTRTPCLMLTLGRQQFEQILTAVPDLRIAFEQVAAARRREDEAILGSL
jgi:signal-transduction protein with cAMP-binding, CBS, and nucleotidyltransferase domain